MDMLVTMFKICVLKINLILEFRYKIMYNIIK